MCACNEPNTNGNLGYKWQPSDTPGVYPVNPPALPYGAAALYDEPGRCGIGCDSHSHHFIFARSGLGFALLVRHGGGDESLTIRKYFPVELLAAMTSDQRYRLFFSIYLAEKESRERAAGEEFFRWAKAVLQKRIKTNRRAGKVEILPEVRP